METKFNKDSELECLRLFGLSDNAIRKILRSRREKNRNTPKQKKEVSEPSPKINSKSGAGTSKNTLSSSADSGSIEEKKAVKSLC
jgi:hypothetical protein